MPPSRAMTRVHRCRRPVRRPRAKAWVVRSDSAPATGVAITEAMAPRAETTPRATNLCRGVMSCSCDGSRNCRAASDAIHMPMLPSVRPVIQAGLTCSSGSASASGTLRSVSADWLVMTPPRAGGLACSLLLTGPCSGSCRVADHSGRAELSPDFYHPVTFGPRASLDHCADNDCGLCWQLSHRRERRLLLPD